MKKIIRLMAMVLVLALALTLAVPATAAAEPKLSVEQALEMKKDDKSPATAETYVYPYAQTFSTAVVKGGSATLQFRLSGSISSSDKFGVMICRGSYDDLEYLDDSDIVEERIYKASDFYNGSIGMTWKADSRYPVGEYILIGLILDEYGEPYYQDYYAVDLYVVNQNIPATGMEVMELVNGEYCELSDSIEINETQCLTYGLTPFVNTASRKTTVTVAHPQILSATVDAGYVYLTGKGLGNTTVTITCGNVKKTIPYTVGCYSYQIKADGSNTDLCVGMTDKITVTMTPANVPFVAEMKSHNPNVVTVNNGVVTAVGVGWAMVEVICAGVNTSVIYNVRAHELPENTPVSQRTATKPAMQVGHCSLCGQDDAVNIIEKAIFTDTDYKAWYSDYVDYVYDNGIMNGSSATTFAPDRTMTRAELVTVLYRLAGNPEVSYDGAFTDVPAGQWYSDAVTWAAQNKVVNGVGNGRFAPTNVITREQVATILYRYTQTLGVEMAEGADLTAYPDCGSVSDYAVEGMEWAVAEGLITGVSSGGKTTLAPLNSASRAQLATIISRYQQMFPADSE